MSVFRDSEISGSGARNRVEIVESPEGLFVTRRPTADGVLSGPTGERPRRHQAGPDAIFHPPQGRVRAGQLTG